MQTYAFIANNRVDKEWTNRTFNLTHLFDYQTTFTINGGQNEKGSLFRSLKD